MKPAFRATLLHKHDVAYHRCDGCGLLQSEPPYWLDEAYGDAIIQADTGLAQRNYLLAAKLAALLYFSFAPRGNYVDVAGGYGLLVRLMRDLGFDFYWEDKFCQNLMARGFESGQTGGPIAAVTAFEVMEHLADPIGFVAETLQRFDTKTLIFSTELYSGDAAPAPDWWYYAFNNGQHISFFQRRTLEKMAQVLGLRFFTMHGLHVFTDHAIRNEQLARLLTSRLAAPVALYIRQRLGSKTMSDHLSLSAKLPE
jgi:hypothetical protein